MKILDTSVGFSNLTATFLLLGHVYIYIPTLNNSIAPSSIPEYPLLNSLSAFEIKHKSAITSSNHKIIWLSPLQRSILQLLDGKITKQEIATLLLAQKINTDETTNNLEQVIENTLQLLATWDLFA